MLQQTSYIKQGHPFKNPLESISNMNLLDLVHGWA